MEDLEKYRMSILILELTCQHLSVSSVCLVMMKTDFININSVINDSNEITIRTAILLQNQYLNQPIYSSFVSVTTDKR